MTTLKDLRKECELFYTENAATYFAKSFNKKMGGTQTIKFQDDFLPEIKIDQRQYYSGRGSKFNNNSMHEHIDVFVTKAFFNEKVESRAKMLFERQKDEIKAKKQFSDFCKLHNLNKSNYTSLYSDCLFFESDKKEFVEKELNVDLSDFFNATGKTYLFAESKIGLLCFYHNHRQSFSFNFTTEEKRNEFISNRESWISAPYAHILGQNDNINLYVC